MEELLDKDEAKIIHKKNMRNLIVEINKSANHLNPEKMWEFLVKNDVSYNISNKKLCKIASVSSQHCGMNSLSLERVFWGLLSVVT